MKDLLLFIAWLFLQNAQAQTWTPIASPTDGTMRSCCFIAPDTGWVIHGYVRHFGNGGIYKTVDGGASWNAQTFPPDPPFFIRFFNRIHFIDAQVGFMTCTNYQYSGSSNTDRSSILWTNDGGITWTYRDVGPDANSGYSDGKLVNDSTAYVIGQYGTKQKTTDGGITWTDQYTVSLFSGSTLFPISADTVYYAGLENFSLYGVFGKTVNGGELWTNTDMGTRSMLAIHFNDAQNGWLGGYGGTILKTTDAGDNWTACITGDTNLITDLEFVDAMRGWATTSGGRTVHSTNGGADWNVEYEGTIALWDLDLLPSGDMGYAVGDSGLVLKYDMSVGLDDAHAERPITTAPNPCGSITHISMDKTLMDAELVLRDARGVLVRRSSGITGPVVDLYTGRLSPGIYVLSLLQRDAVRTSRLVVARP